MIYLLVFVQNAFKRILLIFCEKMNQIIKVQGQIIIEGVSVVYDFINNFFSDFKDDNSKYNLENVNFNDILNKS